MRNITAAIAAALLATLAAPGMAHASDAQALEVRESFAGIADGPAPDRTPAGVAAVSHSYSDGAAPYVRDGMLTTTDPNTAVAGSYRIVELGQDVTNVGAEFAFTPHTAGGGVLCLSIQSSSITDGTPVPASPVHFVVKPTGWSLDVNTEAGTGVEVLASGRFDQPLVSDGETLHHIEVDVDRQAEKVRITFPDGSTRAFTNPAFGLPGQHVYVEPFKSPRGGPIAEQANALVSEWWATTEPQPIAEDAETVTETQVAPLVVTPAEAVQPAPVVEVQTPAPVAVKQAAPTRPTAVKAIRRGKMVKVRWQPVNDADAYVVRCGGKTRTVEGARAKVRTEAKRCKVRAVNVAGASAWKTVRVRR